MKISTDEINEQNYIKVMRYIYDLDSTFNDTEDIQKYNFEVLKQVNRFDDSNIIEYGMIISMNNEKMIYIPLPILELQDTNLLLSTCMNQLSDDFFNQSKSVVPILVHSLIRLFNKECLTND